MSFSIIHGDITQLSVDAIVNAANTRLLAGGGVCGAIFEAAGFEELQAACDKIGDCREGEAVITPGFALPAKFVIHTPGPVWFGGCRNESQTLYRCYMNSLILAEKNGCESIAFPLISAGIFGYPRDEAIQVAKNAISAFLEAHEMKVLLVLFDNGRIDFPLRQ